MSYNWSAFNRILTVLLFFQFYQLWPIQSMSRRVVNIVVRNCVSATPYLNFDHIGQN